MSKYHRRRSVDFDDPGKFDSPLVIVIAVLALAVIILYGVMS